MNKLLNKFMSFGLAAAMLFGVTAFVSATSNTIVAEAATGTYYSPITATSGTALLGQLHDLLTDTHRKYTSYADCRSTAVTTDPGSKANTVLEFYTHIDIANSNFDTSGGWNREHVWAKSLSGGCWDTSGGGSDLHHIRPAEKDLNNHRGNMKYGEVGAGGKEEYTSVSNVLGGHSSGNNNTGTFEPLDNVKGDVARIVMYVYTQYNKAANVNGTAADSSYFGNLSFTQIMRASNEDAAKQLLLKWNKLDPVDEIETIRNEAVYKIQGNRNPFIDNSSYADAIWGNGGMTPPQPAELQSISLNASSLNLRGGEAYNLTVTPNPSNAPASVSWSSSDDAVASVVNGRITAKAEGTATITATSTVKPSVKASVAVTVSKSQVPPQPSVFGEGTYNLVLDVTAADMTKKLYFTGALSGNYGATSVNPTDAAAVEVAKSGNGYTLKVNGQYLELASNNGKVAVTLSSGSTGVWSYDEQLNTLTWTLTATGLVYYMGTYTSPTSGKTFETISGSETKYISGDNASKVGISQFPVKFEKLGGAPVNPDDPKPPVNPDDPKPPVNPDDPKPPVEDDSQNVKAFIAAVSELDKAAQSALRAALVKAIKAYNQLTAAEKGAANVKASAEVLNAAIKRYNDDCAAANADAKTREEGALNATGFFFKRGE